MSRPNWQLVANLGDVNAADYGAFLVYRDTTGAYPPEVEMYEPYNDSDEPHGGMLYRFVLEPPRFKTCSHQPGPCEGYPTGCKTPAWHNEWFVDKLADVARSCGQRSHFYLLRDLPSKDPVKRALAYRDMVGYFGPQEFDNYPVELTEKESQKRYAKVA